MHQQATALRLVTILLACVAALAAAMAPFSSAKAQSGQIDPLSPEAQDARALLLEMEQLQDRLGTIQESALAERPQLRAQAEEYEQMLLQAMRSDGFDPVRSINHIALIEQQMQAETLTDQERNSLIEEAREEQRLLIQAEQAALQKPEIQEARGEFLNGMLVAMREEDPATDDLMNQLAEKNEELHAIVAEAEMEPGSGGPPPQG